MEPRYSGLAPIRYAIFKPTKVLAGDAALAPNMSSILNKVAPLVVFGGMSSMAVGLIGLNALDAGAIDKLEAVCTPNAPYSLPYTGFYLVDHSLCQLVAIFHAGMASEVSLPMLQYFLAAIPVVNMYISVEASRRGGVPSYLAYPVIFAVLWQFMSWGLILSVYSLLLTISGVAQRTSGKITQRDALSIIIAFGVGAALHVQVFYLFNPYATAYWQAFPVVMALTQQLAGYLLPTTTKAASSGHDTIIAGYALTFVTSASFHFALVLPYLSLDKFIEFLPSVSPVSRETGTLEQIMILIMKWDIPIGSGAVLLTSLWFAKSFSQFVVLAIAIVGGTALVGPAAVLSGILIWRETKLGRQS